MTVGSPFHSFLGLTHVFARAARFRALLLDLVEVRLEEGGGGGGGEEEEGRGGGGGGEEEGRGGELNKININNGSGTINLLMAATITE